MYPAVTVTQRAVSKTYIQKIKLISTSTWIIAHMIEQHHKTEENSNAIKRKMLVRECILVL